MKNSNQLGRKTPMFIALFFVLIVLSGCGAQDTGLPMSQRWASVEGGQLQAAEAGEQFDFGVLVDEGLIASGIPVKIKASGQVSSGWLRFELRDPGGLAVWDSGVINPGEFEFNTEYVPPAGETGEYSLGLVYGADSQARYNLGWHAIRLGPVVLLPGAGMILVALAFALYAAWKKLLGWKYLGLGALFWVVTVAVKFAFAIPLNPLIFQTLGATAERLFSPANLATYLYIGAMTGIFEVGLAWLILRKIRWGKATWNQALVFGIGFGAIEALLLGLVAFASALVSLSFSDLLPIWVLSNQAINATLGMGLAPISERLFVVLAHIFSCVLIFYAIGKGQSRWVWLSVLYKTLLDAIAGFANYWGVATLEKIWTLEAAIALFGLIGLWGTILLARRYPGNTEEQVA